MELTTPKTLEPPARTCSSGRGPALATPAKTELEGQTNGGAKSGRMPPSVSVAIRPLSFVCSQPNIVEVGSDVGRWPAQEHLGIPFVSFKGGAQPGNYLTMLDQRIPLRDGGHGNPAIIVSFGFPDDKVKILVQGILIGAVDLSEPR